MAIKNYATLRSQQFIYNNGTALRTYFMVICQKRRIKLDIFFAVIYTCLPFLSNGIFILETCSWTVS